MIDCIFLFDFIKGSAVLSEDLPLSNVVNEANKELIEIV